MLLPKFVFIRVNSWLDCAKQIYGVHWWMPLRWDTIRVEEPAIWVGRLSLHRLPAKRRRALCAVGISAAQRPGPDKR